MGNKIQLTPDELQSQAAEMLSLKNDFESLFSGVTSELGVINGNWSPNLSNNFSGKIKTAQRSFSQVTEMLGTGAKIANKSASSFKSVDSLLTGIFGGLVGNAGTAGGIISAVDELIDSTSGEINPGGIAKGAKSLVSGLYKMFKDGSKLEKLSRMNPGQAVKTGFKRFFGLNKDFLNPSVAKSFGTRFYNNFHKKLGEGLDAFKGKGAKSALAWAGVAVTGIVNGFENFGDAEKGKMTKTRAALETVTETAIDVGTGVVVGAAVSAGIAAAGFASAPVIVVGAVTAGVMYGVDKVFEWATKSATGEAKGFTETVSDFVLDTGGAIVKGGKKVVSSIVKGASSFFKNIF